VNIQLNIVACPAYPEKFTQDDVDVAPFVPTSDVIVTLPLRSSQHAVQPVAFGRPLFQVVLGCQCKVPATTIQAQFEAI